MVLCIPLCCEYLTVADSADSPSTGLKPPENIICPRCNCITDSCYKKDNRKCEICFLCLIPCGSGQTYLVCKSCGCNLGNPNLNRCKKCHVGSIVYTKYCMNCGSENI